MPWLFAKTNTLNQNEIQYLLLNDPFKIVKLEHSSKNKKILLKAIRTIHESPDGPKALRVLTEFLSERASKLKLSQEQEGARRFLLKAISELR